MSSFSKLLSDPIMFTRAFSRSFGETAVGIVANISGDRDVGGVLTCTTDGTNPNYQWKRDGVNISSATTATYTVVTADVDSVLTCQVAADEDTVTSSGLLARYAPVTTANALADQSFTEDTGNHTFATAGDFTLNSNTVTYSVNSVAGVSINSSTGVVTFDSDLMATQSGTAIVVTATDGYGRTTTTAFSVSITAVVSVASITINSVGPQPAEGDDIPIDYTINVNDTVEAVLFLATDPDPGVADFNTGASSGYIDLGTVSLTTGGSGINLAAPDGLDDNYKIAFLPTGGSVSDIAVSSSFALDTDVVVGATLTRTLVSKDATAMDYDLATVTFSAQTLGTGRIVVFVSNRDGGEPTSVTIDGVSASLVTDGTTTATVDAFSDNRVTAWSADCTSASGDIVVNFGSITTWVAVNTYLVENFTAFDDVTVGFENPGVAAPWSMSLDNDTTAGGIVLVVASTFNQGAGGTNFDNIVGVTQDTVAGTNAATGTTIVASATGTALETRTITIGDNTVNSVRHGGISIGIS